MKLNAFPIAERKDDGRVQRRLPHQTHPPGNLRRPGAKIC